MRVELELLYPDSSDMILLDPDDPAHLARAREVIHGLAAPWHADDTAAPRPGRSAGRARYADGAGGLPRRVLAGPRRR